MFEIDKKSVLTRAAACLGAVAFLFFGVILGAYKLPPYQVLSGTRAIFLDEAEADFYRDPAFRRSAPCPEDPIVVLGIGQSNAANTNSTISGPRPELELYNFFSGTCYRLEDPVLGADSDGGSIWPDFAAELQQSTGRPVIVAVRAKNGSSIGEWQRGSAYLAAMEKEVERLEDQDLAVDLVVWIQGERDAAMERSRKDYAADLHRLIDSGPESAEWLLVDTSICGSRREKSAALTAARRDVARRLPRVHIGPDTDVLGRRFRADGCHYNWAGKRAVVEGLMESLMSEKIISPLVTAERR